MTSSIVYERSFFADLNGDPLDAGKVYIGVKDQDPELSPIPCFWDAALTVPAPQPMTVAGGYITNSGVRARVYVSASSYSMRVRNKSGVQIDYVPGDPAIAQAPYVKQYGAVGDGVTNDTTAVTNALAGGSALFWNDGTYLVSGNLVGLHSVKHTGAGAIKRGSAIFYPQPGTGQTNTLYVAPTGLTTNDGLTADYPMSLQTALDALANYGPTLAGKWNLVLAAGTYTGSFTVLNGLDSVYPVVITGPDVGGSPNVPTAIFEGSGSASSIAIRNRSPMGIYAKNLKFQNYSLGTGIISTGGGILATDNVHGTNNFDTLLSYHGRLYAGPGVFIISAGNYSAIRSMFAQQHTIGGVYDMDTGLVTYPTLLANGISITAPTRTGRGILLQEGATGHVEKVSYNNLSIGLHVISSSRAHVADSDFKTCVKAIECQNGSNFYDGGGNTFNAGTGDANVCTLALDDSSTNVVAYADSYVMQPVAWTNNPSVNTLTGTTTETLLHTFASFLSGHEMTNRGAIEVVVRGQFTGSAGGKTITAKLGGVTVAVVNFASAAASYYEAVFSMNCVNTNQQSAIGKGFSSASTPVAVRKNSLTLGDGTAKDLTLHGTLGSAADTLEVFFVEVRRGAA